MHKQFEGSICSPRARSAAVLHNTNSKMLFRIPYTNYFCDKFPLKATFWSRSRYQHKRPWLKQVRPTGEEGEEGRGSQGQRWCSILLHWQWSRENVTTNGTLLFDKKQSEQPEPRLQTPETPGFTLKDRQRYWEGLVLHFRTEDLNGNLTYKWGHSENNCF